MQRPISDIKVQQTEVRATKPRISASVIKDSFKDHLSDLKKQESFNAAVSPLLRSKVYQAGKNPMKFGIVQSTLRDYDPGGKIANHVSELDETKAKQIYQMIWERAGCGKLSPELAAEHFAAYVRRPRRANEAQQKSGGDIGNYAAAIKSGNSRSVVDLRGVKPSLSKAAEVSGGTLDTPKSNAVSASPPIAERLAVTETGKKIIGPVRQQDSVTEIRNETSNMLTSADDGSYSENTIKESSSLQHTPPFKPFSASEVFRNVQAGGTNSAELPIADNGMKIVFEKRDAHAGIAAYESAKSGKGPADGIFVKLRMPF